METANFGVETEGGTTRVELFDLDRALEVLSQDDESLARIVEMKYFGGMTAEQTAEVLGRSMHVGRQDPGFRTTSPIFPRLLRALRMANRI